MAYQLDPTSPTGISKKPKDTTVTPYFAGGPGKPSLLDSVNGKHGAVQIVGGSNVTVDNSGTSIVIAASGSGGGGSYTDEEAQDAVGSILTDTASINFTYNDASNTITAEVNDSPALNGQDDTYYRARANHTGTQAISTVSGLQTALDTKIETIVAGTNVTVDDTDPLNPIVSASGSGGSDDQTADEVPFTPTGGLEATNVQDALYELDAEKASSTDIQTVADSVIALDDAKVSIDGSKTMTAPLLAPGITGDLSSFNVEVKGNADTVSAGHVLVTGGTATDVDVTGGSVIIKPGAGTGSNPDGFIELQDPASFTKSKLDLSTLTDNRILTVPDETGTIATREYVDTEIAGVGGGAFAWGAITGTLADQTDLTAYVSTAISDVIDAAPGALDTLNELAASLGDDADFAGTVTTALAGKQPLDSDLTTIAGLTATTDNFMQSKAGAWASRTIAQVKTDLGLTGTNSGDQTSIVGISGTLAQFNTAVSDADLVSLAGSETLTNKTLTSPILTTPALGTPASGVATSITGLPIATGLTGMTNGTFLTATGASTAVSTKTAPSGAVVGTTDTQTLSGKTLTTPTIGDFTNATHAHTNAAGGGQLSLTAAVTGVLPVANGGRLAFTEVTGTSQTAAVNAGYICNNAGLVTVTIPTTAAVGDILEICGKGAGLFKLAQNASEIIHFGNSNTTTGTGGSLTATNRYDSIKLVCIVADTEWVVANSVGSFTVV